MSRIAWVSGVSGGKGERWKRKRERALLPPPPSPIKNLVSPIPLGRPDTQAIRDMEGTSTYSTMKVEICIVFYVDPKSVGSLNFLGKERVRFPITDEHSSLAVFTKKFTEFAGLKAEMWPRLLLFLRAVTTRSGQMVGVVHREWFRYVISDKQPLLSL